VFNFTIIIKQIHAAVRIGSKDKTFTVFLSPGENHDAPFGLYYRGKKSI